MTGRSDPSDIDPLARPSQFDDVLGTCGELEVMLGRLRREHLLPDDEFARCRREVGQVREQLAERQAYWEPRQSRRKCAYCHTSAMVEYVDALASRQRFWKCLGCGREVARDRVERAADAEHTEQADLQGVWPGEAHPEPQAIRQDSR